MNRRHQDFQSCALPTELPAHRVLKTTRWAAECPGNGVILRGLDRHAGRAAGDAAGVREADEDAVDLGVEGHRAARRWRRPRRSAWRRGRSASSRSTPSPTRTRRWRARSGRARGSTGRLAAPVSADTVMSPPAPTFAVATANAPAPGEPGQRQDAVAVGRDGQRHDIGRGLGGRREQQRVEAGHLAGVPRRIRAGDVEADIGRRQRRGGRDGDEKALARRPRRMSTGAFGAPVTRLVEASVVWNVNSAGSGPPPGPVAGSSLMPTAVAVMCAGIDDGDEGRGRAADDHRAAHGQERGQQGRAIHGDVSRSCDPSDPMLSVTVSVASNDPGT